MYAAKLYKSALGLFWIDASRLMPKFGLILTGVLKRILNYSYCFTRKYTIICKDFVLVNNHKRFLQSDYKDRQVTCVAMDNNIKNNQHFVNKRIIHEIFKYN